MLILFAALVVAIWVYMSGWFLLARLTNRTDLVDTAWGLGFVYIIWVAMLILGNFDLAHRIPAVLVSLWGVRLAAHIARRNFAKTEDDHRYQVYRRRWQPRYWSTAYVRIFLLQGVLLLLICSTAIASVIDRQAAVGWAYGVGVAIWLFGIGFETAADYQLRQFLKTKQPGQIMQQGLWRYSRHPNYFGELTTWWGAAIVACSFQQWWGVIGAAVITVLITKVSGIPPLEKHYADDPAYQQYKRHTSVLIPLPRR